MCKIRMIGLLLFCCGYIAGYDVEFTEDNEIEAISNQDLTIRESVTSDLSEFGEEIQKIYYDTAPKPRLFNPLVMEVDKSDSSEESSSEENSASNSKEDDKGSTFQPWSILWYVGSFGGLIAFFLVVSCSEWCCRNHGRNSAGPNSSSRSSPTPSENPPPDYDLFAPPSYESLCTPHNEKRNSDYEVYVVPVHEQRVADNNTHEPSAPPSYYVVNDRGGAESNLVSVTSVPGTQQDGWKL